jgi:ComF family protein
VHAVWLFDKPDVALSHQQILAAPLRALADFALPPRCPGCSQIVNDPHAFCQTCWQQLDFLAGPACSRCDLPLPFETADGAECAACIASPPRHAGIKAAVAYGDVSRNVALRLKYGGRIGLAKIIADATRRHLSTVPAGALLVPVPLHWTRLWWRSFNQSALIASELHKGSDTRSVPDLLIRKRRTPLLRGLSAKERAKMVTGAFAINPKFQSIVQHAKILLVDDVYTSGATTDACVKVLKKAGAASVTIFCWARVLPAGLETGAKDNVDLS